VVSTSPLSFRIIARDRDWINVGGSKVNPGEVEDALRSFPGVSDARVFGRANSIVGQLLCAEVVANPGLDEMAVRSHVERCLPTFKVPRLISVVDSIDRTRTGKLRRL
jgi:acyl-coenzyme A synthetase/AMP-(fatty) acid ligase